jgi:hypothetical protein
VYLELVQGWHRPEEEILGWAKHGEGRSPLAAEEKGGREDVDVDSSIHK